MQFPFKQPLHLSCQLSSISNSISSWPGAGAQPRVNRVSSGRLVDRPGATRIPGGGGADLGPIARPSRARRLPEAARRLAVAPGDSGGRPAQHVQGNQLMAALSRSKSSEDVTK